MTNWPLDETKKKKNKTSRTDPDIVRPYIWEKDTVVVNGYQLTVMFPPDLAEKES